MVQIVHAPVYTDTLMKKILERKDLESKILALLDKHFIKSYKSKVLRTQVTDIVFKELELIQNNANALLITVVMREFGGIASNSNGKRIFHNVAVRPLE